MNSMNDHSSVAASRLVLERCSLPRSLALSAALLLLPSGCDDREPEAPLDPELRAAAEDGLAAMLDMAAQGDPTLFGFSEVPSRESVTLEAPIQVHYLALDAIASGTHDVRPSVLDHGGGEWWFPIDVDGTPVSQLGLHKTSNGWEVTTMGDSTHMRAIEELRREQAQDQDRGRQEYFLLLVPAMYHSFVAYYEDGAELHLMSVFGHEEHGIEASVVHDGAELLAKLGQHAQATQGALDQGGAP